MRFPPEAHLSLFSFIVLSVVKTKSLVQPSATLIILNDNDARIKDLRNIFPSIDY